MGMYSRLLWYHEFQKDVFNSVQGDSERGEMESELLVAGDNWHTELEFTVP
jgi:hypothetical protein